MTIVRSRAERHRAAGVLLAAVLAATIPVPASSDEPYLFINEVIAENGDTPPRDVDGGTPDMVEIYNGSDSIVQLGTRSDATSFYLSDTLAFDPATAWRFPEVISGIAGGGRLVVFCDGAASADPESLCELHASFRLASDGVEPISLWGPEDGSGERPLVDQVWLPPLRANVSFGRHPDGAGPAPVPLDIVLDVFVFNPLDSASPPTFGRCDELAAECGDRRKRSCRGAANGPGANLEPRVERVTESTNAPAAGEPVRFTVRVRDDGDPVPPNIAGVEIVYTARDVSGSAVGPESISMETDGRVVDGAVRDETCAVVGGSPLERWSLWSGEVPGQPTGTVVEFFFRVTDAGGRSSTSPQDLCLPGVGPCHRELGGPGCARDEEDVACETSGREVRGERFVACSAPFTYVSGYAPRDGLAAVVLNEVVPFQDGLLQDETELAPCTIEDGCNQADPFCCMKREDFVELHNASDEAVDLSGLWLSDSLFHPRGWQFPPGSTILPRQYLVVWLDDDGGKCPDRDRQDPPCFWECPDPTDPGAGEYHANFALEFSGDQVFLRDTKENGYGIIHGLAFALPGAPEQVVNRSLALLPDGDRAGCFGVIDEPTPGAPNPGREDAPCHVVEDPPPPAPCDHGPRFVRSDCNGDGRVTGQVADAVFLLNHNFTGGPAPPCLAACDANGDGRVLGQVADAVYMLAHNFTGGPPPPAPFPGCGTGGLSGDGALGCGEPPAGCP